MKRHKYFREQKHKQKLEAKYYTCAGSWFGGVYFITAEPDPRSIRESQTLYAQQRRRAGCAGSGCPAADSG